MTTTVFDVGGLDRLGEHLGGASRVLLVVSPSRRFVERALGGLGAFEATVFDGARVHVPQSAVDAAQAIVDEVNPEVVIAVGGGATIGLAKALRLDNELRFVAVPTTYSGSEMTSIYGISRDGDKRTGRDERVRADVVIYDATTTTAMPVPLSIRSLGNSLAHIASALSTDSIDNLDESLATAAEIWRVISELEQNPENVALRERALRVASRAGEVVDTGTLGMQHTMAHRIGGRFDLEHSAVHSILLVPFLAWLRHHRPELAEALDRVTASDDLAAAFYDQLRAIGETVSLRELGVTADGLAELLEENPHLSASVAWDAYLGIRPCADARIERADGRATCIRFGPEPAQARQTILALHGRGANAGRMLRDVRAILGDPPDIAIVVPQAPDCAWYPKPYTASLEDHGAALDVALDRAGDLLGELATASGSPVVLFGFSQGACLALELAARRGGRLGAVVAICGARIGPRAEQLESSSLADVPMLLGAARDDRWLAIADIEESAAVFEAAGARVELDIGPGDAHEITTSQRQRARDLLFSL